MPENAHSLEKHARKIRELVIRTVCHAGAGHTGGALSVVEIMTALYFYAMITDPLNPRREDQGRCILLKGHASAAWYYDESNIFILILFRWIMSKN